MGHYFFAKTFAAGKAKATQESMNLLMTSGVVHEVYIDFPAGCQYLTHVKVMRGEFQVFPRNIGAYYAFNGFTLPVNDYWQLRPLEKELTLVGYNEDDTHAHTIRLALQVTEPERFWAEQRLLSEMERFIGLQEQIVGVAEIAQLAGERETDEAYTELWEEHATYEP